MVVLGFRLMMEMEVGFNGTRAKHNNNIMIIISTAQLVTNESMSFTCKWTKEGWMAVWWRKRFQNLGQKERFRIPRFVQLTFVSFLYTFRQQQKQQ